MGTWTFLSCVLKPCILFEPTLLLASAGMALAGEARLPPCCVQAGVGGQGHCLAPTDPQGGEGGKRLPTAGGLAVPAAGCPHHTRHWCRF